MDNGLSIPSWSGRRAGDALARVKAEGRRTKAPCVICRQSIDYSLAYPHKQSCSVQHLKSRKAFPQLTWDPTNWAPAHLDCNKAAGADGAATSDLGVVSEDW